ncbi:MAG TPA: hypothetical protein VFL42_12685 [Terriglobales bacterium]|nr:hypothetical protein [Terriglobales bacterium]
MKKFSNIQAALDFAATNQYKLKFPFNCKCNGSDLKVLTPDLARTTDRDPTLVVTRNRESRALELGYVVSMKELEQLLQSISTPQGRYQVLSGAEQITVACHSATGLSTQFTFPLAHRIPELAAQEGDFVLLFSRPQSKDWHRFWLPLETRLLHSSLAS